jgi:hypothetical protein
MLKADNIASMVNKVTIKLEQLHEGPKYHGLTTFHTMHSATIISMLGMA